jgi:hypothetical protein
MAGSHPAILCFTPPPPVVGGAIVPIVDAVFAFRSLWLVSSSVRPFVVLDIAGRREGGLSPLGRTFSVCDGGRSMTDLLSLPNVLN